MYCAFFVGKGFFMKNTFGTSVSVTLFGESHGAAVGAVIDGLAPGLPVDEDFIAAQLTLRRPSGNISTARRAEDAFRIVSGVFEGRTTGTPQHGHPQRGLPAGTGASRACGFHCLCQIPWF